jgi:hypothetical protein
MTHYGKCPRCKSKNHGHIFNVGNLIPTNSKVMCFNGDCDFSILTTEWNVLYPHFAFKLDD